MSDEPVSKRDLTTREKIIILRGSKLNGLLFPPWSCEPEATDFATNARYMYVIYPSFENRNIGFNPSYGCRDDAQFSLSSAQSAIFDGWCHSGDLLPLLSSSETGEIGEKIVIWLRSAPLTRRVSQLDRSGSRSHHRLLGCCKPFRRYSQNRAWPYRCSQSLLCTMHPS